MALGVIDAEIQKVQHQNSERDPKGFRKPPRRGRWYALESTLIRRWDELPDENFTAWDVYKIMGNSPRRTISAYSALLSQLVKEGFLASTPGSGRRPAKYSKMR